MMLESMKMLPERLSTVMMILQLCELAKALGRPQTEIDTFTKRALYYRNLFDKSTNFMRGRNKDGCFPDAIQTLISGGMHLLKDVLALHLGCFSGSARIN